MADKKITELTELISPAGSDVFAIVDDPAGSPETKKITFSDIEAAIIHTNISGIGTNTHPQIDSHISDTNIHFSGLSGFDTDDLSEGTTNKYSKWDDATGGINYTGGNVGIGTSNPSQKLDVNGSINIDGSSAYLYDGHNAIKLATKGDTIDYTSTIIGRDAGDSVTNGTTTRQTAIGYYAGYLNSGASQTALGSFAGYSNSGAYQTALSYYAGRLNTGAQQTAIGYYAGYLNSGFNQTALGYGAGRQNTGNYQTALGMYAGFFNTGHQVTGIGYEATRNNSGNDVVALGYQAGKDNTVANQFIVKQANINAVPLIQGDFASGNVGIGTTSPEAPLEVNGEARLSASTDMGILDNSLATKKYVDDNDNTFNTSDFSVSSGEVSLKNKTSYASIPNASFKDTGGGIGNSYVAGIQIPNNAVITGAILNGSNSSNNWLLRRIDASGASTTMATENVNTEETTISNATIDNDNYSYLFIMDDPMGSDSVYRAKVKYTTDYI